MHICRDIHVSVEHNFLRSSVHGRSRGFHVLAIVNSAAMTLGGRYLFELEFSPNRNQEWDCWIM